MPRAARTVAPPTPIAIWQDVVATENAGIWRGTFRTYDPLPPGTMPKDDYRHVPLSVFVDAVTGVLLPQACV